MKSKFISLTLTILSLINMYPSSLEERQLICGQDVCDAFGGICTREGRCKCYEGYTTNRAQESHIKCNYEQKSAMKAGIFELTTGCGIGHFYAGRITNGTFKLMCVLIFCMCCFTSLLMIKKIREETEAEDHPYVTLLTFSAVLFKLVIIIWQLVDSILFFLKIYKDGNGIPLCD